jgi:hypothetical protein
MDLQWSPIFRHEEDVLPGLDLTKDMRNTKNGFQRPISTDVVTQHPEEESRPIEQVG